jgi:hypothetical protein
MLHICSFVWVIHHVQAYGRWKNPVIMVKLGDHGSIFPIHQPIVKFILAKTVLSQLQLTMM